MDRSRGFASGLFYGRGDSTNTVRQLIAVVEREGDGYVATCLELDIVSQGNTIEEARRNLVEAVEGFFGVASASEIRRRLTTEMYVMSIMPTVPANVTVETTG
jgi:predicted RNase H-like HicB family nuclease